MILLLLSLLPLNHSGDRADILELNHYYDRDGEHVFDQIIAWEWDEYDGCYHVMWWTMADDTIRMPSGVWLTKFKGRPALVFVSGRWRETWTQYDPEYIARDILPCRYRKGLIHGRAAAGEVTGAAGQD